MNYEILKKYRESKNLTQEKMAKQLGIAHSGYVCVENGYKEPSLSVLKRMSEVTGFSLEALVYHGEKEEYIPPAEELNAYKAISFNLLKTLCVAPEGKRLGRNERDIDEMTLKRLKRMLDGISGKDIRAYERAVKKGGH